MDVAETMEAPAPRSGTGCAGRMVQVALFVAVLIIAFGTQLWAWAGPAISGGETGAAQISGVGAALAAGLLLPFALAWRPQRERAIYRTWFAAFLYPFIMAPTRLLHPARGTEILLLQLGVTLLFVLGLHLLLRRRNAELRSAQAVKVPDAKSAWTPAWTPAWAPAWGLAYAVSAIASLPWVLRGALGSWEEAVLSLLLGLAFGAAAALLLALFWWPSLQVESRGRGADIFTGGLVAAAALAGMAGGLSFNGLQLTLMFVLPGLCFAAVALAYAGGGFDWRPPALLLGLPVAAVLAFTDAGPLAVEAGDPALGWAWQAALASALWGWLLALAALLWRRQWGAGGRMLSTLAAGVTLWIVVAVFYLVAGQPGFYGDRLFVTLETQADVAFAAEIEAYDERRQAVYATLVEQADDSQAGLRGVLDRWGLRYTPYYLVNGVEVEGGLLAQLLLARDLGVDRILPSPRLRPLPGPLDPGEGIAALPDDHGWNLVQIGATRAWRELGARGAGIVIGESDSGVDVAHPELADGYRGRNGNHDYAWFDPWSHTTAPVDYGGHGTHTLATVAGNTTGVAPDATWIACANLQRNLGNPALYLDCLQFMLAPFPIGGDPLRNGNPLASAHVLNNSWGCPQDHEGCDPTSLQGAVDALRAAGIFVVASAGNDGPACSTIADPIALYDAAFTVGAVDQGDNLAVFSSVGPVTADGSGRTKPDIAAPGVDVWSAYPGGGYAMMSGTSMAGPHIAGVVALMWSANPALIGDIEATERILHETARPFSGAMQSYSTLVTDGQAPPTEGPADPAAQLDGPLIAASDCSLGEGSGERPNNLVGYGVVDAFAAVQQAMAVQQAGAAP